MKQYTTNIITGGTVFALLLFVFLLDFAGDYLPPWLGYAFSVSFTTVATWIATRYAYRYCRRKHYKEIRNNWRSTHVAGMFPRKITFPGLSVKPGSIPFLRNQELAERVVFVPHEDVQKVANEIRAEIEEAYKGVLKEDRHPVKVYTYAFREALSEEMVFEKWDHYKCEGIENSYPARILRSVKAIDEAESVAQYGTSPDYYRSKVMGQTVTSKVVGENVFEW